MSEQHREKLSAFMDGAAAEPGLVDGLSRDAELKAAWGRYHLIRDAVQGELSLPAGDLASRISLALEAEPAILAPRPRKPSVLPVLFKQAASFAVAASVTAAVIFGVQGYNARQVGTVPGLAEKPVQAAPLPEQQPILPLSPMVQAASAQNRALDPRQEQLRAYLKERSEQAHDAQAAPRREPPPREEREGQ